MDYALDNVVGNQCIVVDKPQPVMLWGFVAPYFRTNFTFVFTANLMANACDYHISHRSIYKYIFFSTHN